MAAVAYRPGERAAGRRDGRRGCDGGAAVSRSGSDDDARWDTYRNCAFNEILGFDSLAYYKTLQVTILGLGPI